MFEIRKRLALLLLVFALAAGTTPVRAQSPNPLEPIVSLAGGTWIGEGKWPDGSPLRVEQKFFWGPTRRVLHFECYDLTGKERKLLYEGFLFFDPKRGKVVQWNFKPTGEATESVFTEFNATGFEVKGEGTWSIIRYGGAKEFHWELRVPEGQGWQTILNATYRRQE